MSLSVATSGTWGFKSHSIIELHNHYLSVTANIYLFWDMCF